MKNFDELAFDTFAFRGCYDQISLQYMIYKIFKRYNMVGESSLFFIPFETLYNFSYEIT